MSLGRSCRRSPHALTARNIRTVGENCPASFRELKLPGFAGATPEELPAADCDHCVKLALDGNIGFTPR